MKRLIGILLSVTMLATILPVAVFAEAAEVVSYQSSTDFSTANADGTWGTGNVWSSTLVTSESGTAYSTVTTKNGEGTRFESAHGTYVDADEIAPVTGNGNKDDFATYGGAKTFTAPYSGAVTISYADVTNGESSTGAVVKVAYNQGVKFRVTKQTAEGEVSKIYPADADYVESAGSGGAFSMVASGATHTVSVSAGDKLHFEVMRMDNKNPWQGVLCDPIITYGSDVDDGEGGGEDGGDDTDTPVIPADKAKFISSEDFSTTSGNGTWGGVWSASMLNFNTDVYTSLSASGDGWESNGVAVNNTHMIPYKGNAANATANNHIGVAKTFTAPKDGYVQISYATVRNPNKDVDYGVSVHQTNRQMSFRVRLESAGEFSKIYPKAGEFLESRANDWDNLEMLAANTITNTIEVKQGDKLHFEVKKTVSDQDNWNGVHCDPIVEYIDEADVPQTGDPADKKVYKASESFTEIENGDYAWRWQYYDVNAMTYNDLTHVSKMEGFGLDGAEAPIWYLPTNTQYNKERGVSVGAYGMRVSLAEPTDTATDGEKNGEIERNIAVKSFTAPKRGEVTISADVFRPGHSNGGAAVRILKHSVDGEVTKLYPTDEDWLTVAADDDAIASVTTELNKGEKLTFENALWKNNSAWHAMIIWDPVITYTRLVPIVDNSNTEENEVDVPLNKEHVITYSGEVATPSASDVKIYEVALDGTKTESDATVKSVSAEGNDIKLVLDGLKPYTKYEVQIEAAFASSPADKAANTLTFTTGAVVMIGEAEYADNKVTVDVNNSADTPAKATLAVFLCNGTETEYTVESARIITRTDIGANDTMEAAITMPAGSYFIKAMVLEDAMTARAYAPMTILKGDN